MEDCIVKSVESSTIKKVGYCKSTNDLVIEFLNGNQYLYEKVPEYEFEGLVEAESVGTYFADEIKDDYECFEL